MINQSENLQDVEITDLTAALISALGIKNSEDAGDKIQSATIFLTKLHRKYANQQSKKFNEVKLCRLNGLLYKVCKNPPQHKSDVILITDIIFLFLNNEGSNPINENTFASNTCLWVARVIEEVLSSLSPELCQDMLLYLLYNKKPQLKSSDDFEREIASSEYFKDKQIIKEDEEGANKKQEFRGFMTEHSCLDEIKNSLDVFKLFRNLSISYTGNQEDVLKLFVNFCLEVDVPEIKNIFMKVFVTAKVQTKQSIQSILECLDSQIFSSEDFNQVLNEMLATNERKLFHCLTLKGIKNQSRYIEILSENMQPNFADELAKIFINSNSINNYYLLYLIQKSNQKLSPQFLTLPSQKQLTNRMAIICTMSITHNLPIAHTNILQYFFQHEGVLNGKQKLDFLRIAHFSYLDISKTFLFTQILKLVPVAVLDAESHFQFLPKENCEKINVEKNQLEELADFLSRYFGNSSDIYWIKLDLYSICGKQLPCMQDFKKVQKIFETPVDQILQELPSVSENILGVVLMGINNKLVDQYMVDKNSANVNTILQWALDCHKKEFKKFKTACELFLKKSQQSNLLEICLQLFDFNLDKHTELELSPDLSIITNAQSHRRLKGLNFSEYFMGSEEDQNEIETSLLKNKSIVIELHQLIRMISNETRSINRKQLKAIISEEGTALRALKLIKLISQFPLDKHKNPEKIQAMTDNLLGYITPHFESLKDMPQRANNVNIPYVPLFESLEFLLNANYEKTLNFLAQLLKSRQVKTQEKGRKSKKKNTEQSAQRMDNFIENIECCFRGDPSVLSSYDSIISIIQEIEESFNQEAISVEVVKWVEKINIFHTEQFASWKTKVLNYVKLWETIANLVMSVISIKQIERHFLIMIDLLNTLYEKYRTQKDKSTIQKKIFNGFYILYSLAESHSPQMQDQAQISIPTQKLNQVLINYEVPQISQPHLYYCFDCCKKICQECSVLVHRYHDKNYIGIGQEQDCHRTGKHRDIREIREMRDSDRLRLPKEMLIQKMKEGNFDILDREKQAFLALQNSQNLSAEQLLRLSEERLLFFRRGTQKYAFLAQENMERDRSRSRSRDKDRDRDRGERGERGEREKRDRDREDGGDLRKKLSEDEDYNLEIKSCSEKQFNLKNPCVVFHDEKPTPSFANESKTKKPKKSLLNLTPLFNLLLREIQSNSFISVNDFESEQKNSGSLFEAEISNQKYAYFKLDLTKANGRGTSGYISSNPEPQIGQIQPPRRGLISINDKLVTILSPTICINFLESGLVRNRFSKKEAQKRYRENDAIENYMYTASKSCESGLVEVSLSPYSKNTIAEISQTKIVFESVMKDGKSRILYIDQEKGYEITKFEWLKSHSLKSFYSFIANGVVIVAKIQRRAGNEIKERISLENKKIKDYSTCVVSSKMAIMTILDQDGKLYRSKIDPYHKMYPNFKDYQVEYNSPDPITSVHSHGVSVCCTTSNGKITILNFTQDNKMSGSAITFPIIQNMKSHKISQINNKFREVSKIHKLRYIFRHHNQIYFSCVLAKESVMDNKKSGYFVILSVNIQNKKSKVVLFNDQGTTDSYDFMMLNEKEFLFMCFQDDGELWTTKFTSHSKTLAKLKENHITSLSLSDIAFYCQEVGKMDILNNIEHFSKERRKSAFKENIRITDHYKTNITDNYINFQPLQKFLRTQFPTGIEFGYNHNPEIDGPTSQLKFSLLGNQYQYRIERSREIQIPLSIKQTLAVYMGLCPLKIQFTSGNPISHIKNITLFGVKYTDRSVYLDALTSIFDLVLVYGGRNPANDKLVDAYLFNEQRLSLETFDNKQLETYFAKKKMRLEEQNLLLKLELFRESIPAELSQSSVINECFESIRTNILSYPYCYQRKQLLTSTQKLLKSLTLSHHVDCQNKPGHILDSQTQLDIFQIFKFYQQFQKQPTVDSLMQLLQICISVINTRTINAYVVFSVYPDLLENVRKFFAKLLAQYHIFFKTNQHGLQRDQKVRVRRIWGALLRLLIENYMLTRNCNLGNQEVNCEYNLLKIMESVFCPIWKEIQKEIKLIPFQNFESVFKEGTYENISPAINFLALKPLSLQQPLQQQQPQQSQLVPSPQSIQFPPQPAPALIEPSRGEQPSNEQLGMQEDYSWEEHKENQEENREMMDDFVFDIQGDRNLKGIDDDDDDLHSDFNERNEPNSEDCQDKASLDTSKLYEYLKEKCGEMVPDTITFMYEGVAENILLEIFSPCKQNQHKYLNSDNILFYIDLVFNILHQIERNLQKLSDKQGKIDSNHPYIQNQLIPILKRIDSCLDSQAHSVLFLPINTLLTSNPKQATPKSALIRQWINFYSSNPWGSLKWGQYLHSQKWYQEQIKKTSSLASLLRFQMFQAINSGYQLKFVGNIYLHMLVMGVHGDGDGDQIRDTVLNWVVKYQPRVFYNIMVVKNWGDLLENTKLKVAFQRILVNPIESLKFITKSINRNPNNFISSVKENGDRILALEELLGKSSEIDEMVLQILISYYNQDTNQA